MDSDFKKHLPPDFDFEAFQKEAIKKLKAGKPLSGKDGVMMPLIKQIVEAALKGEFESHLEAEPAGARSGKNGRTSKNMRTDYGAFELDTPRDRNATFEPELVKKRQTVLGKMLDDKIIALYGLEIPACDQVLAGQLGRVFGLLQVHGGDPQDNLHDQRDRELSRQIRKVTKTKGAFSNENSLLQLIYLTIQNISKKWTQPPRNWSQIVSQLSVFFEGRLKLDLRV